MRSVADAPPIEKHSRPNHPTTCAKVERFHQTLMKRLKVRPRQPHMVTELQALCDQFVATTTTADRTAP